MGSRSYRRGRELDRRFNDIRSAKGMPYGRGSRIAQLTERALAATNRALVDEAGDKAVLNARSLQATRRVVRAVDDQLGERGVWQRLTPQAIETVRRITRQLSDPNISVERRDQLLNSFLQRVRLIEAMATPGPAAQRTTVIPRPPRPPQSGMAGQYRVTFTEGSQEKFRTSFGTTDAERVMRGLGAPAGSRVTISRYSMRDGRPTLAGDDLQLKIEFPDGGSRSMVFNRERKTVYGAVFRLPDNAQGGGLATTMLRKGVNYLSRIGYDTWSVPDAAGTAGWNGAYTWPRLGFNASLIGSNNRGIMDRLRDAYSEGALPFEAVRMTEMRQVMANPVTRAWWRNNYSEVLNMRFDMRRGSEDRKFLADYLRERRARARGSS